MKKSISGIRGIVGNDLKIKDVIEFCNNFSTLIRSKKCVIAMDTRKSGQMIKDASMAALMQNGIDVFDLGVAPTPVAFYEARRYGAGLIITASHNPMEWNGLKFIIDGRGINQEELKTIITKQERKKTTSGKESKIQTDYIQKAKKLVQKIDGSPKVIVDVGGGAARHVAPKFLEELGCSVMVINEKLEETTRGPDPTAEELDMARYSDADIGFAFDLDGDRLVVVKNGKKQTPDVTLGLGVVKALEMGCKKFILSIDTSISVEKFIKQNGGTVQRSKVGEANVIEQMIKTGAQAGGEGSSAGFILSEFNFCRDGILTSGLITSMLQNKKIDEVLSFMAKYHQLRDKVPADSKFHDQILNKVIQKMKEQFNQTITLDGVKGIIDEDTWILVRRSNTEDVIRISVESDNLEKANKTLLEAKKMVNQSYEEIK